MIDVKGDLWAFGSEPESDRAITITTNCSIYGTELGIYNPMGGGCAFEAATRFPRLPYMYARHLSEWPRHPRIFAPETFPDQPWWLICMPVKEDILQRASVDLITQAAVHMAYLPVYLGIKEVIVPRPGSGLGGLDYERDVRPQLQTIWGSDTFKVITHE